MKKTKDYIGGLFIGCSIAIFNILWDLATNQNNNSTYIIKSIIAGIIAGIVSGSIFIWLNRVFNTPKSSK